MPNFEDLPKQSIRNHKLRGYFENARDSLNDWEKKVIPLEPIRRSDSRGKLIVKESSRTAKSTARDIGASNMPSTPKEDMEVSAPKMLIQEQSVTEEQPRFEKYSIKMGRLDHSLASSMYLSN